ncbi:MAG TPA: hypothetical protein VGG06_15250 [Thermoanaerobaculia bacterium]|jgi:hypothetical protein
MEIVTMDAKPLEERDQEPNLELFLIAEVGERQALARFLPGLSHFVPYRAFG